MRDKHKKYLVYKDNMQNDWFVKEYDIVAEFDTEAEAVDYCEEHNWEYKDDNNVWWDLNIWDDDDSHYMGSEPWDV